MPHTERWVLERLGHRHMGFEPEGLELEMKKAGFGGIACETHARDASSPFRVFLLTGEKSR